ncbi:MAG: hypothetical protein OXK17_00770 [Thaumarchaeota archaeon]|nr:hypothetical protein [Nitrososphaerota archaeon]
MVQCSARDHYKLRGDVCPRCGVPVRPDPAESLDNFACIKQEEVNGNMLLDEAEGDYLNASFVQRRKLTTVRIVDEGEIKQIEDKKNKGKIIEKPCFGITYVGQGNNDPFKWTLNNKTRNALIDLFGHDTSQWINQNVEITLAGDGEYRHATVDMVRTRFVPGGAPPLAPAPAVAAQAPPAQAPAATAPATAPA